MNPAWNKDNSMMKTTMRRWAVKQILLSGQEALVTEWEMHKGPGIKTALGKLRLCRGICCPSSWQGVWTSSSVNIHFLWNNLPCWNHSGNTLGLSCYLCSNPAFLRCLKLWCTCASPFRQPQPCWGFVRTFSFRGSRVRKFRSLTGTEMLCSPQDR